jgi:hypothetical protein
MRIGPVALNWPSRKPVKPVPLVIRPYVAPVTGWRRRAGWVSLCLLAVGLLVYGFYYAITTPYLLKAFLAPFVPLAAFTVWALPESGATPTRSLNRLYWAFFLGTMLWPNYLALALPGLPWISVVRLLGLPLAIVLLVRVSTSKEFVGDVGSVVKSIPALGTFMAVFVAIQVLSIFVSSQPLNSVEQVFDNQISWTAIFFVSCFVFRERGTVERWAAWFCISSVLICVMCLWEIKLQHVPWAGHLPSFFPVNDPSVQHTLAGSRRLGTGDYRIEGNQSTSLGLAEFLALATPFFLHFVAGDFKFRTRAMAALSLPFVFFMILETHARLGMVGFFLSILIYLSVWSYEQWRSSKSNILGPAIMAAYPVFFVVFVAASFFVQRLKTLVWGNGETAASNEGRMEQIRDGIPLILKRPWGYGTGQGAEKLGFTDGAGTLTIDNYYLLVALDWGILGVIFYYGLVIMSAWAAGRNGWARKMPQREYTFLLPAGIALVEFFVIKSIFSQTFNHKLQFMIMGMIAAVIHRMRNGDSSAPVSAKKQTSPATI